MPYIYDHVIHGQVLFPGVAFVEMARQTFVALAKTKTHRVEQLSVVLKRVRFQRALSFEEGKVAELRITVDTKPPLDWLFEVLEGGEDTTPYVSGMVCMRGNIELMQSLCR
jgi:Polyketide synthase dehydratase